MNRQIFDINSAIRQQILLAMLFLGTACQSPFELVFERMEGATMGTYYGLVYQGCGVDQSEIEAKLKSLNDAFSTYDPNSEISVFNRGGANKPFNVSEYFAAPLEGAAEIWAQTDGALDPTVGPLVDLWGFGPAQGVEDPSETQQEEVASLVGWHRLRYQNRILTKDVTGLRLDLSAIAKGYAVDELAKMMSEAGCSNYMVDIGGEMAVAGKNADGGAWRLGIERPDPDSLGSIQLVLEVSDMSVATSGDYRNYRVVNGKRVDHVMDPRTSRPADNDVVSATVVHPEAMYADGYATAAMVLGVTAALALAEEQDFALLLMTRTTDDDSTKLHYNSRMESYMVSHP